MGERRGVYKDLGEIPEGKRPLWRPRRKWGDKIKMDFQEVVSGGMESSSCLRLGIVVGRL